MKLSSSTRRPPRWRIDTTCVRFRSIARVTRLFNARITAAKHRGFRYRRAGLALIRGGYDEAQFLDVGLSHRAHAERASCFSCYRDQWTRAANGRRYTNVIPIPVDDPTIKNIAGAFFKPSGSGPFPGVVFMTGCAGPSSPEAIAMQKTVIDHLLAKGVATLLVNPFTPRNEPEGICADLNGKTLSNMRPVAETTWWRR